MDGVSAADLKQVSDLPKLPNERQHAIINGEKVWFFGKQFLDQPTYHFGHFVSFAGGNSKAFDINKNEFSEERPFAAIAKEENLSEIIFTFQSRIYLLLYVLFGRFRVTSLHKFNETSGEWEKSADIQTDSSDEIMVEEGSTYKQSLILVDGEANDGVHFVSFVDHKIHVHLLKLSDSSAKWETLGDIHDEEQSMGIQPTAAVLLNKKVFIQGGVHGCGFRFQPQTLIQFSLDEKSVQFKKVSSDEKKPSFAFAGAHSNICLPSENAWAHITGQNASGMTGSVFNGQIWLIRNLDSEEPEWEKLRLEIPDPKDSNYHVIADAKTNTLIAFSKSFGVQKGQLLH